MPAACAADALCMIATFAMLSSSLVQAIPAFGVSASRRTLSTVSGESVNWTTVSTSVNGSAPPLVHHTAAVLSANNTNHSMLLFGGRTVTDTGLVTLTSALWSYMVEDSTWTQIQPLGASPTVREMHSACSNGSHMLIHGGRSGRRVLRDTWLFERESETWSTVPVSTTVVAAVYGHSSVWIGQTVYIFGGTDSAGLNTDGLIALNASTSVWWEIASSSMLSWPYARSFHSATVLEGCMVLYGGQFQLNGASDSGVALGDVWSYCLTGPDTGRWTVITNSTNGYWDLTANQSMAEFGLTSNNTGAPVSSHVTVSVSDSLMVSVSGHNVMYTDRLWCPPPTPMTW